MMPSVVENIHGHNKNHRRAQISESGMAKFNLTPPLVEVTHKENYRNFQYKLRSDPFVGDWKM